MTHETLDVLATRRLRAAADKAHASSLYCVALDRAAIRGVDQHDDLAVKAAAAYVKQTRVSFEDARLDHERALAAAAAASSRELAAAT